MANNRKESGTGRTARHLARKNETEAEMERSGGCERIMANSERTWAKIKRKKNNNKRSRRKYSSKWVYLMTPSALSRFKRKERRRQRERRRHSTLKRKKEWEKETEKIKKKKKSELGKYKKEKEKPKITENERIWTKNLGESRHTTSSWSHFNVSVLSWLNGNRHTHTHTRRRRHLTQA